MTPVTVRSASEWADACSRAFVPLAVHGAAPRFSATLDQVSLASGVSVTRVCSGGSVVSRAAGIIARDPRDDLLVSVHRAGRGSVEQHGRVAGIRAGQAAAYDASVPYTLRFPARMSELVLQVPRRIVTRTGHGFDDLTAKVLPPSASLTALTGLMTAVVSARGYARQDGAERAPVGRDAYAKPRGIGWASVGRDAREDELLTDAALTLLLGVLLPTGPPATTGIDTYALDIAMRAYVEQHLTDPGLTVDRLAASHYVSVRLVHKIFSQSGDTPAAYVRRRRLAHARTLLLDGATVTAAAMRSGFTDTDSFTRAFKRDYGVPPSQLRLRSGGAAPC